MIFNPQASILTTNTKSIHTNINTGMALIDITQYIHERESRFYPSLPTP